MSGKFYNDADEYVHELTMDGADEESGSVDETGYWAGLVRLTFGESVKVFSLAKFDDSPVAAILTEDSVGFVTVRYYNTTDEANADWRLILDDHAERHAEGGES